MAYLALLLAIGCADDVVLRPVAQATAPSPTPNLSVSGVPSSSPGASASPDGSPGPSPSPGASASPSVSPSPASGAASPSASPTTAPINVDFESPSGSDDFTRDTLDVRVVASPDKGVKIKEMSLYYDDVLLVKQTKGEAVLELKKWNPHVKNSVDNKDTTEVSTGTHSLRVAVIGDTGGVGEARLSIQKPVVLRAWVSDTPKQSIPQPLPSLVPPRWDTRAVALRNRLFSFLGRDEAGALVPDVQMLNVDVFGPQWVTRMLPGTVTPRLASAVTGLDDRVYLVGGHTSAGGLTAEGVGLGLFDSSVVSLPPLPLALTEASAAVLGRQLYVVGGSTTNDDSGASRRAFRLALSTEGKPTGAGASWETLPDLPEGVGLVSGSLVVHDNALYWLGGRDAVSRFQESIVRFNASNNRWDVEQYLPRGVARAGVASFAGFIWVLGGEVGINNGTVVVTPQVVRYEPRTRQVVTFAGARNLPVAVGGAAAVSTGTHLYVLGGYENAGGTVVLRTQVLRADVF